jgi:hypothetical protein
MPIQTDECAQYELDKDIRAVHSFIERHQLKNEDPRMKDYIKDRDSGKFSPADLAAKYPDHDVYVRTEGGRPVKMKVTNPYRAYSYRYPLEGSASFAEPAGISEADKPLHKQNIDLLKAIAPASVIADKRFATAILESLWRCSASQDLAGKPACFPARVLGELRLFQKYHDQASRKQLADDVRVFSEWGMVSDIMRQMIRGVVPPVRADAAQARKEAAEEAAATVSAAAGARVSGEPVAGASSPAMPVDRRVDTTISIGDYVTCSRYTPRIENILQVTNLRTDSLGTHVTGKKTDGSMLTIGAAGCRKITKDEYDAAAAGAAPAGADTGAQAAAAASSSAAAAPAAAPKPPTAAGAAIRAIRRGLAVRAPTQIGALGPRFQHGILPPTTIGAAGMVV